MRVGGGSRTSLCSNFGDFGFGRVFETEGYNSCYDEDDDAEIGRAHV